MSGVEHQAVATATGSVRARLERVRIAESGVVVGGQQARERGLRRFVEHQAGSYREDRNIRVERGARQGATGGTARRHDCRHRAPRQRFLRVDWKGRTDRKYRLRGVAPESGLRRPVRLVRGDIEGQHRTAGAFGRWRSIPGSSGGGRSGHACCSCGCFDQTQVLRRHRTACCQVPCRWRRIPYPRRSAGHSSSQAPFGRYPYPRRGEDRRDGHMNGATEATVEDAALDWLREIGWSTAYGPDRRGARTQGPGCAPP